MPLSLPRLSYGTIARMTGLLESSAADAGVVTTSTGPRRASSAMSGVVRTVSPKNEVCITRELVIQRREWKMEHGEWLGTHGASHFPFSILHFRGSIDLENRQKSLLRNLDGPYLFHPLFS